MHMTHRELRLARILATSVAVLAVVWMSERAVLRPCSELRGSIQKARTALSDARQELDHVHSTIAAGEDRLGHCLPSEPTSASTRYYTWLLSLATESGLKEVKLQPSRSGNSQTEGTVLNFRLTAKAPMNRVGDFLCVMDTAEIMHRVERIQISGYSPITDEASFTVSIDALCGDASDQDRVLPSAAELVRNTSNHGSHIGTLSAILAERRPFTRYEPPRPEPARFASAAPVPPAAPPKIDGLAKVVLVGITANRGERQAWFYDALTRQESLFGEGDSIRLHELDGVLKEIHAEAVLVQTSDRTLRLELGRTLRSCISQDSLQ